MNRFKEVLDAFYSEQDKARASDDYTASLAWDTAVDNWDRVMKGVSWETGATLFTAVMDSLTLQDPENKTVWETAKEYVELAS